MWRNFSIDSARATFLETFLFDVAFFKYGANFLVFVQFLCILAMRLDCFCFRNRLDWDSHHGQPFLTTNWVRECLQMSCWMSWIYKKKHRIPNLIDHFFSFWQCEILRRICFQINIFSRWFIKFMSFIEFIPIFIYVQISDIEIWVETGKLRTVKRTIFAIFLSFQYWQLGSVTPLIVNCNKNMTTLDDGWIFCS